MISGELIEEQGGRTVHMNEKAAGGCKQFAERNRCAWLAKLRAQMVGNRNWHGDPGVWKDPACRAMCQEWC